MSYIDKNGKLHEGLEDLELDDWINQWASNKEKLKKEEIPLVINIPEDEIDTITGEKKPKQCEGCSS